MALITRQFGPSPKGSILSFEDMDNNLIYLEELTKLDLIPLTDNVYVLGTTSSRWKSINVGQLKFVDNTIESTSGATDIQIGLTSSAADLRINRDVVLAPGKTLTFGDGSVQSTAAGIIQQYTPTSSADSYGVTGSLVRDNENIYVRTNGYGWRVIPFNNSYGSFYDTTSQGNTPASTARPININSTATASGVSIQSGNRITVDHDGIYNIQFSLQLIKTSNGNDDADIWLRYNGNDVPNSNGRVTIIGNNGKGITSWNFVQAMTASSYCQIYWSSSDTGLTIFATSSQTGPTRPAIPSIIVTVDKISSLTII